MNEQNLRPFTRGERRARDAGRKGGQASGEARRRQRAARMIMRWAMELPELSDDGKDSEQ